MGEGGRLGDCQNRPENRGKTLQLGKDETLLTFNTASLHE